MIETERLVLRRPRLDDAAAFLELHRDPVAMEFIGGVHPDVENDPEFPVRRWLERWEQNGIGPFVVQLPEGQVLGRTGFLVWDARNWTVSSFEDAGDHGQAELGWAFARENWGHGYATEAAAAARAWGRGEGVGALISLIAPANIRSQRVAEKLGCAPGATVELFDSGRAVAWVHP